MLGPLPRRYRMAVAALVLGTCVIAGLWMGLNPRVPVLAQAGLALGLLAGVPLAWLLTHAPRHGGSTSLRTAHRHH